MIRSGLSHSIVSALILMFAVEIKAAIVMGAKMTKEWVAIFAPSWSFEITGNSVTAFTIALFFCWGVVFHYIVIKDERRV